MEDEHRLLGGREPAQGRVQRLTLVDVAPGRAVRVHLELANGELEPAVLLALLRAEVVHQLVARDPDQPVSGSDRPS